MEKLSNWHGSAYVIQGSLGILNENFYWVALRLSY